MKECCLCRTCFQALVSYSHVSYTFAYILVHYMARCVVLISPGPIDRHSSCIHDLCSCVSDGLPSLHTESLNSLNALVFFVLYKRSYKDKHCMDFFYCFVHACVMVPSTSQQGIQ